MSTIARQAAKAACNASRFRSFSSTSVSRKDLVQDIYLREIKSYKAAPVAKDAHVGSVKAYTMPPVPKAPAVPADITSELSAYDASEPSKAEVQAAAAVDETAGGADSFLEVLERDLPKEEHHH
ncbi:ATP synthase complex subunit H-domain-containing protein [Mycena floridula]|nr:ATP synthase complex subunit H-domain-containing protein [Mycena floridula]